MRLIENEKIVDEKPNLSENDDIIDGSAEKKLLKIGYVKRFVKYELTNAEKYCYSWDLTNGITFKSEEPKDIIFNLLELIIENKRKVYIDSYDKFKRSVYQHIKWVMLTFFKCGKNFGKDENKNREISLEESEINEEENYKMMYDSGNYEDAEDAILKDLENEDLRKRIFSLFDENNDKEADEILVLELILKGYTREEISNELGISVDQFTNIQKRIKRKIRKKIIR